jgi:hypothetical protein
MKATEVRKFLKTSESRDEVARMNKCTPLAVQALGGRVLAICVCPKGSNTIQNIGSCVVVKVDDRFFICTAAHVLDTCAKIGGDLFLYGGGVFAISGNRFLRGDDFFVDGEKVVVDAAAWELEGPVPEPLTSRAFDEAMIASPNMDDMHLIMGFPSRMTNYTLDSTVYGLAAIPTGLWGARLVNGKIAAIQFGSVVVHDVSYGFIYYGHDVKNGVAFKFKKIDGTSGGGVFLMEGVPRDTTKPLSKDITYKLVALIVEVSKRSLHDPPLLICTNVHTHFGMIKNLLSEPDNDRFKWKIESISEPLSKGRLSEMHLVKSDATRS